MSTSLGGVDVVVIGGGHAGCEAAAASARTGARTVLLTQKKDTIGELSCNPSIGGIGKGHLVREVDALDGLMGRVIDEAGIHFRMLNQRKGPAVRGPRAQADRDIYRSTMQAFLQQQPNLEIMEGSAEDLLLDGDAVRGVVCADGAEIAARAVVITTGTFLRGKCYIGDRWYWAGRHLRDSAETEPPSVGLAETLERFAFPLARLKTGTPPRIDGNTIDWGVLDTQPSEVPPSPFSYMNAVRGVALADRLIACGKAYTNAETHRIVMESAHLLPAPSRDGVGPRYCPSLYKKCERFPDRTQHLSWLEPEGLNTNVVYPNGLSGPFPEEVQLRILRSMRGLEAVEIVRPGYDVEYDYVQPTSLHHTLETKRIGGLFLAGQICGTTGYEEAAAQGIVAGANAGLKVQARPSMVIGRDEAYIGVLIDDLVTRGTDEPYRMFTSRAEYRLSLRQDNADLRLTEKGRQAGIVGAERYEVMQERRGDVEESVARLMGTVRTIDAWGTMGIHFETAKSSEGRKKSAAEVIACPDVTLQQVEAALNMASLNAASDTLQAARHAPGDSGVATAMAEAAAEGIAAAGAARTPAWAAETVEAQCKYANYVTRQVKEMETWRRNQDLRIPADIQYTHEELPPVSAEELEKAVRPTTFAAAGQISGLTPNSLVYLYHYVTKRGRNRDQARAKEVVTHHFMEQEEAATV
ncbi:glucose inhibited division protein A-domain-containing protein [Tribonema minus]|uniref:Glucose inhibited division protein A-domain-containing protein n=1 Tax=Tribonema minus TaxID=303371 RepID=A0A835YS09_9STRA|nr:glucose inhibited division protein A-domain-containing protein [Tribonema minus]